MSKPWTGSLAAGETRTSPKNKNRPTTREAPPTTCTHPAPRFSPNLTGRHNSFAPSQPFFILIRKLFRRPRGYGWPQFQKMERNGPALDQSPPSETQPATEQRHQPRPEPSNHHNHADNRKATAPGTIIHIFC